MKNKIWLAILSGIAVIINIVAMVVVAKAPDEFLNGVKSVSSKNLTIAFLILVFMSLVFGTCFNFLNQTSFNYVGRSTLILAFVLQFGAVVAHKFEITLLIGLIFLGITFVISLYDISYALPKPVVASRVIEKSDEATEDEETPIATNVEKENEVKSDNNQNLILAKAKLAEDNFKLLTQELKEKSWLANKPFTHHSVQDALKESSYWQAYLVNRGEMLQLIYFNELNELPPIEGIKITVKDIKDLESQMFTHQGESVKPTLEPEGLEKLLKLYRRAKFESRK